VHCFPMRTELVFERNSCKKLQFSRWRKAHFVPKGAIQQRWRNTCISPKKTIYVRSSSIYHIVSLVRIELGLEGNTSCNLPVSMWRKVLFAPNRPTQVKWWNTCISVKKIIYVRSKIMSCLVFLWELKWFLKGLLPANHSCQGGEMLILCQIGLFSWLEETLVSL
jgi:hypothetical protein